MHILFPLKALLSIQSKASYKENILAGKLTVYFKGLFHNCLDLKERNYKVVMIDVKQKLNYTI